MGSLILVFIKFVVITDCERSECMNLLGDFGRRLGIPCFFTRFFKKSVRASLARSCMGPPRLPKMVAAKLAQ